MRRFGKLAGCFLLLSLLTSGSSASAEWDARFGIIGPLGEFEARIADLLVEGDDVYVVGPFASIDRVPTGNVARWDGQAWSSVGNPQFAGGDGALVIARHQGNLVVAGDFTSVNGQAGDVAVYDGVAWSPLGNPALVDSPDDDILALLSVASDLYIGGNFSEMLVRWDGASITPLVSSVETRCCEPAGVWELAVWDGDVVAGGVFKALDGVTLENAGRWDGSQWQDFGSGLPSFAEGLHVYQNELYAETLQDVYRWTGTDWVSATGRATQCQVPSASPFHDVRFHQGSLYRTGATQVTEDGSPLFGIARWNGAAWDDMEGGIEAECSGWNGPLAEYQGQLLVGGSFDTAGGLSTSNLAAWTGLGWLTNSPDHHVRAIVPFAGDIYVAGTFLSVAGQPAGRIARWDGTSWSTPDSGVDGDVHDLLAFDGALYAAGEFSQAGAAAASNVARWDGATWEPLAGTFLGGSVFALATDGASLYVGGDFFLTADAALMQGLARWDGSTWHPVGSGAIDGSVFDLVVDGSTLYVAGDFTTVDGLLTGNTARWDGDSWSAMGLGFDGPVRALALHEGALHAGGDFTARVGAAGAVNHLARWDGSTWQPVPPTPPNGTDGPIYDLESTPVGLLVAGQFQTAGGAAAANVAQWTESGWQAFGEGVDRKALSLALVGDDLWIGGEFANAGNTGSAHVARWSPLVTSNGVGPGGPEAKLLGVPFPNPFNPTTSIRYLGPGTREIELAIYDAQGRRIRVLSPRGFVPHGKVFTWDGRTDQGRRAASGVYYARLTAGDSTQTRRMVLLK